MSEFSISFPEDIRRFERERERILSLRAMEEGLGRKYITTKERLRAQKEASRSCTLLIGFLSPALALFHSINEQQL